MNLKDTLAITNWVLGRATLADVEQGAREGLVLNERFSESAVRAYRLAWTWCGRNASAAQWRFAQRCGQSALDRRIHRARRLLQHVVGAQLRW